MRVPTEPETATLGDVVSRAVELVDPDGSEALVSELLTRFEDRDEPVTAVELVDVVMAEATGALDPDETDPALAMAAAVAVYLAHRRDELDDDREHVLRLAARAEFEGEPPPAVASWLDAQGLSV